MGVREQECQKFKLIKDINNNRINLSSKIKLRETVIIRVQRGNRARAATSMDSSMLRGWTKSRQLVRQVQAMMPLIALKLSKAILEDQGKEQILMEPPAGWQPKKQQFHFFPDPDIKPIEDESNQDSVIIESTREDIKSDCVMQNLTPKEIYQQQADDLQQKKPRKQLAIWYNLYSNQAEPVPSIKLVSQLNSGRKSQNKNLLDQAQDKNDFNNIMSSRNQQKLIKDVKFNTIQSDVTTNQKVNVQKEPNSQKSNDIQSSSKTDIQSQLNSIIKNDIRKVSPLHASRMQSQKTVTQSRNDYRKDEQEFKEIRLSIEKIKHETMNKFETIGLKSPHHWRDNLVNFRIRRKILNRENSLTITQKEQVYNDQSLTQNDLQSLKTNVVKQLIKEKPLIQEADHLSQRAKKVESPSFKIIKCLQQETIDVITSQNKRLTQTMSELDSNSDLYKRMSLTQQFGMFENQRDLPSTQSQFRNSSLQKNHNLANLLQTKPYTSQQISRGLNSESYRPATTTLTKNISKNLHNFGLPLYPNSTSRNQEKQAVCQTELNFYQDQTSQNQYQGRNQDSLKQNFHTNPMKNPYSLNLNQKQTNEDLYSIEKKKYEAMIPQSATNRLIKGQLEPIYEQKSFVMQTPNGSILQNRFSTNNRAMSTIKENKDSSKGLGVKGVRSKRRQLAILDND